MVGIIRTNDLIFYIYTYIDRKRTKALLKRQFWCIQGAKGLNVSQGLYLHPYMHIVKTYASSE